MRAQAEEAIEEPGPIGDEDICELVNGYEVEMGEAGVSGYYIQALKNNNGAGILVLTDVFGFRNNATRDIVLRLACFGYKYAYLTYLLFPLFFKNSLTRLFVTIRNELSQRFLFKRTFPLYIWIGSP